MTPARLTRFAAIGALVGLVLMIWAVLDSPLALIVFMSVGQMVGTASLILYIAAVATDVRQGHAKASAAHAAKHGSHPPPGSPPTSGSSRTDDE